MSAQGEDASGLEGDPVYGDDRLPVAVLPKHFPQVSTVRYHFYRMRNDGTFIVINELLSVASRVMEDRNGDPTAAIIDSQSVKSTGSGGVSGYDAGKKIKGRITVDTQINLLVA